jgi:hypothetical protein
MKSVQIDYSKYQNTHREDTFKDNGTVLLFKETQHKYLANQLRTFLDYVIKASYQILKYFERYKDMKRQ